MATLQTEIESEVTELATESLEAFCEDISGMFGVEMECKEQEVSTETVAKLKERFKKLVAVNIVDSEGILNGTFQLIFDQEGLFTLGGVMVMLPEKRILANMKDASADLAESMVDAVGEAGNLLVGAWERIFREEYEDHGHFLQRLPAFVGEPWDDPEEKIGLSGEQELVFIPYEMSIAPYPAFKCGVIFPKAIFEDESTSDSEDASPVEDDAADEAEAKAPGAEAAAEEAEPEEPQPATEDNAEETKAEQQQPSAEEVEPEEPQPATQSNAEKAEQRQPPAEEAKSEEPQPATENNAEEAKVEQPATESDAGKAKPVWPVVEEAPAAKTPDDEVSTSYTPDDESSTTETPTAEAADEAEQIQSPEAAKDKTVSEEPAEAPESAVDQSEPAPPDASVGQSDAVPETSTAWDAAEEESQEAEPAEEPALGPISEAIKEMARLSVSLAESRTAGPAKEATPDGASELLGMCAKDIMQNRVVWADPDDSVQQALTKLQQYDIGYLAVGYDGILEGIVSKADVAGAMSPYLRPMFGKWRRPSDDATLRIRLKWIMSRPVRTTRPDTPLATILENMCRFNGRVLPVVDEQGKVHGLVTAFDIFQKLLNTGADVPTAGKAPQGPPL